LEENQAKPAVSMTSKYTSSAKIFTKGFQLTSVNNRRIDHQE